MDVLKELGLSNNNSGASCGNSWHSDINDNDAQPSINPATTKCIAHYTACTTEDYQEIIIRLQDACAVWRNTPAPTRGDIIRQIAQALRENKDALGTLVSMEMGKSKQEGDGEVQEMIDIADFAVGQSRMLYGKTMHSERPEHRMYEQWHPYGIVGIISAFNFPVAVWAWNAFIAAVCGNVCLWKPSEKTSLCAIAVHNICKKILAENNCPDIFAYFIPPSHELAEQFVDDKRIALISFTGSTETGRHIASKVATRLGNCILELGGNNAIIVDETAVMDLVIPAVVFGAIGTAGQRCTSTRRLIVHKSLLSKIVESLKDAYQQITIGDPLDNNNLMGPLIDADAVAQYQQAIEKIKASGGTIVFGGKVLSKNGFYVEPTLVTGLAPDNEMVQCETFAPILYILEYDELDQAIAIHNNVAQGLSSALFTRDLQSAELFLSARGSDCGIANINIGTSGAEIGGAFGGEKDTGGGREAGSDAWRAYMRRQTNTINWSNDLPLAQGIEFNLANSDRE